MACILKWQIHSSSWWTWITLAGFTLHVVPPTVMAPLHLEINATVHDPCHCIWQQQFSPCLGTWNQSLEEWWYINISLGLSLLGLPRLSGIWLLLFPLRINPGSHCGRPPAIRIYRQGMSELCGVNAPSVVKHDHNTLLPWLQMIANHWLVET